MTKYPEYIMEYLRQRRGLDENDTTQDAIINQMTSFEAFEEVCCWEFGYSSWPNRIKNWIQDIYKIELE